MRHKKLGALHEAEHARYVYLSFLTISVFVLAVSLQPLSSVVAGSVQILLSTGQLFTDYIAVSGMGAAFFNVGCMMLLALVELYVYRVHVNGTVLAAFGMVAGFSFFGKNLFNSLPIMLGVWLYTKLTKQAFKNYILVSLFGTALGPAVSFVAFGASLPWWVSIPLSWLIGCVIGFCLPPLASHFLGFHQGYSLYNMGFVAGILGMMLTALFRLFLTAVPVETNLYEGPQHGVLVAFLYGVSIFLLLTGGYLLRRQPNKLSIIYQSSGRLPTDFEAIANSASVAINVGLMGIMLTSYAVFWVPELNGPIVGSVISAMSFGAFGKHLKNTAPVLVGITIAKWLGLVDATETGFVVASLFGTTLAPISGYYGAVAGMIAGFVHVALVGRITYLHEGLNLYNNGFSGGFVAATLVPIFDAFLESAAPYWPWKKGKKSHHG